jgi:hypothetical protein
VVPLGFQTLGSYKYDVPLPFDAAKSAATPQPKTGLIPPEIKALDGRTVAIQGFMVPTVFESDGVKSFILAKDQQLCCYGVMPKMNEWVDVRMAEGHKADFFPDRPITVTGKMEVGEQFDDTIVLSIYRIEATRVSQ